MKSTQHDEQPQAMLELLEPRLLLTAFVVDSLADTHDANPGDGIAVDINGDVSLRAAIEESNALAGTHKINFASGVTGTIVLTEGQLTIDSDLTIVGPGSNLLTFSGNDSSRVLRILNSGDATISGLSITQGKTYGNAGAGILNLGQLTLSKVSIYDNYADYDTVVIDPNTGDFFNIPGEGGGIHNEGDLIIEDSYLHDNFAYDFGSAIMNYKGNATIRNSTITNHEGVTIYNTRQSDLIMVNSTLSGNDMGIDNDGSDLTLEYCTITDNSWIAVNNNNLYNYPLYIKNSIIAGNHSPALPSYLANDVNGSWTSEGFNIIGDANDLTGSLASDLIGVDPMLGALADNGGPTMTHMPLVGSPAIDGGDPLSTLAEDQRGYHRPVDGGSGSAIVDIGAVEYGSGVYVPLPDPNGDFNGDGIVDLVDLVTLGENYNTPSGATKEMGDADGNGTIDLVDLVIVGETWGMTAQPMTLNQAAMAAAWSLNDNGADDVEIDLPGLNLDDQEIVTLF